jgi:GNAT superfamily N-acetyltransferase
VAPDQTFRIETEPISQLHDQGLVPISFTVEFVLDVELLDGGVRGVRLAERQLDDPWVKDYDAIAGAGPAAWAHRFDVEHWGLLGAHREDRRIGGAVVAFDTTGLDMLRGRRDLAVLWDIRVQPDHRGAGVGAALFDAACAWARTRRCRALHVETQNTNVPACRFYRRMGCTLASIDRFAYPDLPGEVQMIWHCSL